MEGKSSDWRPGPTVCRCCLSEGCYKDISTEYFWMGRREVYSEMLSETLDLSIAYSNSSGPNSNSRLICEQCISRLRDASEFKRQVIDCEKTFMQHLNPGSSSKSRDFLTSESNLDVKIEAVKHEKESLSDDDFDDRPDFLDVDSDDDLDNQPLTKLASKIPKKEAVDILDLLDASQITVKRKSNLKTKEPPKKVLKKKETKAAPRTVSKPAPKQADKKKDEEWTTAEVKIEIPVEFENTIGASNEWITTDSVDLANTDVSKAKHDYKTVDDEWVTLPINAAEHTPPVKPNFCLDEDGTEWVITDTVKDTDTVQNSPDSNNTRTKTHQQNKQKYRFVSDPAPNVSRVDKPDSKLARTTSHKQNNMEGYRFVSELAPKASRLDEPASKLTRTWKQEIIKGYRFVSDPAASVSTLDKPAPKLTRTWRQEIIKGYRFVSDPAASLSRHDKSASEVDQLKWNRVGIEGAGEMLLKTSKRPKPLLDITTLSIADQNAVLLLRNTTAVPYRIENVRSIIPCFACGCKFLDPLLFRDHFIAEHQSVDKANGLYGKHRIQTRVDITDLSCLLCTQPLDNLDEAAAHLVQMHKIGIDLNEKLGLVPLKFPERGLWQCAVCGIKFSAFRELYRHSGTHFANQICEVCGMQFEAQYTLNLHVKTKHVKGRLCIKCKAIFPSSEALRQHVKEERSCSNGYCKICDKAFGYWQSLQKHREAVHGVEKRIYSCSVCQKVFEKRMQMYLHFKQKHTDSYKCKICNKKVCGSSGLKQHMRTHSGLRAKARGST